MTTLNAPRPTLLLLSSLLISTQAFHVLQPTKTTQPLKALIYGWDGHEEEIDTSLGASSSTSYLDIGVDPFQKACSPMGTAVAESLSYDRDRAGHLARLAVAFSPPDQALTLDKIEKVEVVCVHDDCIDIQAILCEHHGCVSLSVPVQFPKACYSNSNPELEGCVIQNLEALDATAGTLLQAQDQTSAIHNAEQLGGDFNAPFDTFPNWWIPPPSHLMYECQTIQHLLNEDEFQPDVQALAQDVLKRMEQCQDYKVLQARVAMVGPAGIGFKVRAVQDELFYGGPVRVLEVLHPFDQTLNDSESLRAAVLGAVAAADGN